MLRLRWRFYERWRSRGQTGARNPRHDDATASANTRSDNTATATATAIANAAASSHASSSNASKGIKDVDSSSTNNSGGGEAVPGLATRRAVVDGQRA